MKPSEVLRKALAKFGPNGEYWIQGTFARTISGRRVSYADPHAHLFCSFGALRAVNPPIGLWRERRLLHMATGGSTVPFNDAPGRTFPEIKAMFEKAIALAEAEESKVV